MDQAGILIAKNLPREAVYIYILRAAFFCIFFWFCVIEIGLMEICLLMLEAFNLFPPSVLSMSWSLNLWSCWYASTSVVSHHISDGTMPYAFKLSICIHQLLFRFIYLGFNNNIPRKISLSHLNCFLFLLSYIRLYQNWD